MACKKVGLELLYATVQGQVTSTSDLVTCAIHWSLISNGYQCVGLGETATSGDKKSELLPPGWADNQDVYLLRYKPHRCEEAFVLKILRMGDTLFVHFMRNRDEKVTTISVKISEFAGDNITDYQTAFRNTAELNHRITNEILQSFTSPNVASRAGNLALVASPPQHVQSDPTPAADPRRPIYDPSWPGNDPLRDPSAPHRGYDPTNPADPRNYGRDDLDPLGGRGGGMIFDPFRPPGPRLGFDPRGGHHPGLPRGSVPPGARFDPINPHGIPPDPDPDHLPPPGYDDMFM